jgi:hypothetical protein
MLNISKKIMPILLIGTISFSSLYPITSIAYDSSNTQINDIQFQVLKEKHIKELINSITNPITKKVINLLYSKKSFFLKKYWKEKWFIIYMNYLAKIESIISSLINNDKYKKYKELLHDINDKLNKLIALLSSNNINELNRRVNAYLISEKEKQADNNYYNNINNSSNNNTTHKTTQLNNINKIPLREGITNEFKLRDLMKVDIDNFDKNPSTTWKKIENKYPAVIKNFSKELNDILSKNINELRKEIHFPLEDLVDKQKEQYNFINKTLNLNLPNIDRNALKKTIKNIESNNFVLPDKDFNNLLKQSNTAKENIKKIIQIILNENTNRAIFLRDKKLKDDTTMSYFGENIKIYFNPYNPDSNCIYTISKNIENTSLWKRDLLYNLASYNSQFFTFYELSSDKKTYNIFLYKKSKKCFDEVLNWFNIIIPKKDIHYKKAILSKLGAKYLLGTYNNLLLLNNKIYKWFSFDYKDWANVNVNNNNTDNNIYLSYLLFKNDLSKTIYYNKYPYMPIKDIKKYYKKIFLPNTNNMLPTINITRYNFLYLGEKELFKNNLYYFNFLLDSNLSYWVLVNNVNLKQKKDYIRYLSNQDPKAIYEYHKRIANVLATIYKIIYDNNFKTLKDIYSFITKNYKYDYELYNLNKKGASELVISSRYNIESFLKEKKGVCNEIARTFSLLVSFYWIPSWIIILNRIPIWKSHAISLIAWNIYDPTYDISKNTFKWFWKTFMTKPDYWRYIKNIYLYYPVEKLKYINKNSKIFTKKIYYNNF